MCLAIPVKLIKRINDREGVVAWSDVRMQVGLELVPEAVEGDWVLVHTGYAIQVMDPEEAKESLAIFSEVLEHGSKIE
jgi:hydrogenase expression/formation protein HypC